VTPRLEVQGLAYSSTEGPSAAGLQYGCSKRDRTGQADPAFYLQKRGCPTGLEPATFPRATIRRQLFLHFAEGYRNGLVKRITLHAVARCFCELRVRWCQQWCQSLRHSAEGILMHTSNILWSGPGSRQGYEPRLPLAGPKLYEMSHPYFAEPPFYEVG
jgi:transposase